MPGLYPATRESLVSQDDFRVQGRRDRQLAAIGTETARDGEAEETPGFVENAHRASRLLGKPGNNQMAKEVAPVPHGPSSLFAHAHGGHFRKQRMEGQEAFSGLRIERFPGDGVPEIKGAAPGATQRRQVSPDAQSFAQIPGQSANVRAGRTTDLQLETVALEGEHLDGEDRHR